MTDIQEVAILRRVAIVLRLANVEILAKYSNAELAAIYNGIGSDDFPVWLRWIISRLHPTLEVVALIHDAEWHESDKTYAGFFASNLRFVRNAIRASRLHAVYGVRKWAVVTQGAIFGTLCQVFGWRAWCSSCECFICRKKGGAR